ncbi:MAG: gliding motility-associated C-terminal domain-containing protein, partial [Lewinella sp.]|nr:gliding motility-associated C-terminal domain-containing protein [Lewinella sp.]
ITFTGTAGAGATYDWDFDGGTATGTDAGPYDVTWPAAGAYTVSLTVTEAGCVSNTFTAEVVVDPVIEPVVIVCQETTNTSITFAWDPVANADTYTVAVLQGPTGAQNGNTYTVDGLAPDDVVTIEVTASGTSSCGASVATGECVAQACQPLTLALDGPTELCAGESATLTFDLTTGQAGDFIVTYSLDAGTSQQMTVTDGDVLTLPNLQASTTILITDVTSADLADCSYPQDLSWDITVQQPPTAGDPEAGDALCFGTVSMVNLGNMLVGADAGGTWTETSGPGSTGGAFNAANGTFSTGSQAPGTYQFTYAIDGGLCADASATVEVEILPLPTVNAGQDQELTCNMGMVVLGNSATTSGPGVIYNWTTTNPNTTIPDPGSLYIDISAPGLYTLEVTDANGCINRDEVVVTASQDAPVADPVVSEITCYGDNNGAINLSGITGGQPPYSITINDGAPTTETFYGNLGGGIYDIVITDANGCFTELSIELIEPAPVAVDLMADLPAEAHNTIELGEGVDLQALFDPAVVLDTILWVPDSIGNGLSTRVHVMPDETSMYRVTIVDANGCSDSDFINIIVNKERQVYIPSAFSPNGDGTNDILYIQGDDKVANVKSFLIFNRWGESVFENYDFQVNDPLEGWDGTYRGQMVNSAVYVYYAEVEFIDGEVVLFKGDVVVMH